MFRTGIFRDLALCVGAAFTASSVISVAYAGSYEVFYSFKGGSDAARPLSVLLADKAGNLYGTTWSGGGGGCGHHGCGTVFELTASGAETVLYAFRGGSDGANPPAGVVADKAGDLFGATEAGGASGLGTAFKLAPDGTETVLHSFSGRGDGTGPQSSLVFDEAGNLYGTTVEGGVRSQFCLDAYGCGTVFEVTPDGTETVRYSFCIRRNCSDGMWPTASLLLDSAGNLFGTTVAGGVANCEADGCGTISRLNPKYREKALYRFCNQDGCGLSPAAGVIADAIVYLYGTAGAGEGYGIVFKLAPDGVISTLYTFQGSLAGDGNGPVGGVIMDERGNFYGTTVLGGDSDCSDFLGCGIVFKLAPDGTETILHAFQKKDKDGIYPKAGLVADGKGFLYGTTYSGGAYGYGTVFRVKE